MEWEAKGSRRAVLLCIHGLGLHCQAYAPTAEALSEAGISVCAVDVRGFGHWVKRNVLLDFNECIADIAAKVAELRADFPNLPLFLLGESMGGAVAMRFTALHGQRLDGLILCAPARSLYDHKLDALQAWMNMIRKPGEPLDIGQPLIQRATGRASLRQSWFRDEMARLQLTPAELFHMQDFFEISFRSARLIDQTPVLMMQGFGDRVISPRSTIDLYTTIPSRDKDLVILGDTEHLIFQNPELNEKALSILLSWLEDHSRFCFLREAS